MDGLQIRRGVSNPKMMTCKKAWADPHPNLIRARFKGVCLTLELLIYLAPKVNRAFLRNGFDIPHKAPADGNKSPEYYWVQSVQMGFLPLRQNISNYAVLPNIVD